MGKTVKPSNQYAIAFTLALSIYAMPADAIGKRDIPVSIAENGVQLSLSRGYGVVLNLATIGQTVSTAWLSDPSQITLASNQGPCTGDACAGSSVLYLKPIEKLKFPGLPTAVDGASLLSVITNRGQVLQFKLTVNNSVPSYTNIALVPGLPPVQPRIPLQQARTPVRPIPSAPVRAPKIVVNLPDREEELDTLSSLLTRPKQPIDSSVVQTAKAEPLPQSKPEVQIDDQESTPRANPSVEVKTTKKAEKTQTESKPQAEVRPEDKEVQAPVIQAKAEEVPTAKANENPDNKSESPALSQTPATAQKTDETLKTVEAKPTKNIETGKSNDSDDSEDFDNPIIVKTDTESFVIAVLEPVEESETNTAIKPTNQELAGSILRGLHSPRGRKEVGKSVHYYRAQDLIYLLRKDKDMSLAAAIQRSRMDESVANALIRYGNQ